MLARGLIFAEFLASCYILVTHDRTKTDDSLLNFIAGLILRIFLGVGLLLNKDVPPYVHTRLRRVLAVCTVLWICWGSWKLVHSDYCGNWNLLCVYSGIVSFKILWYHVLVFAAQVTWTSVLLFFQLSWICACVLVETVRIFIFE